MKSEHVIKKGKILQLDQSLYNMALISLFPDFSAPSGSPLYHMSPAALAWHSRSYQLFSIFCFLSFYLLLSLSPATFLPTSLQHNPTGLLQPLEKPTFQFSDFMLLIQFPFSSNALMVLQSSIHPPRLGVHQIQSQTLQMYKDKPFYRYLPSFEMIDYKLTIIQSFVKALIVGA